MKLRGGAGALLLEAVRTDSGIAMTTPSNRDRLSRRGVLRSLTQLAALAGGARATAAFGQDANLQALIEQNLNSDLGESFDSASRTIAMPKASLPTLSPATVQHTEQAIAAFEGIVAQGAGRTCRRPSGCGSAAAIPRCWPCASG